MAKQKLLDERKILSFAILLYLLLLLLLFYNNAYIEIYFLDFANNFLFDNIFWVDEITISAKKITLIDYKQQIVILIGPINHS